MMKCFFRLALLMAIVCLAGCSDDEPKYNIQHPLHLGSSTSDTETRVVESEKGPQKGQSHRSSDNFSTKGMDQGTHLLWCVPDGITFDIMLDKSAASDPTLAASVTNGLLTPFSGDFKNTDKLYIANPKGATGNFQVSYTVVNQDSNDVYVSSAQDKMSGQSHRSSANFTLRRGRYTIECPDGITFSMKEDKTAADDNDEGSGYKNGMVIDRPRATNIYICDPKGAAGSFTVKFIYTPNAWMSAIDDSKYLYELSIPGTHDSSTWLADPGYYRCQNFDFLCQLDHGIRYFDIRLDGNLHVCHGSTQSYNYSLEQVIEDCRSFLEANPSETIMMQIKDDDDTDDMKKAIKNLLNSDDKKDEYAKLLYRKNTLPRLGDVRGKIVILRRFPVPSDEDATNWGIDLRDGWPSNGSGWTKNRVYVEDLYFTTFTYHDTGKKSDAIQKSLDLCKDPANSDALFLTFSSISCAVFVNNTPWDYAWGDLLITDYMNKLLNNRLVDFEGAPRTGVILMDFYNRQGFDDPYKLVDRIISFNR